MGTIVLFLQVIHYNESYLLITGVIILILTFAAAILIIFYFKSVLSVLKGIRGNISYNTFHPLLGIKTFTILTYIYVGLTVFGTLVSTVLFAVSPVLAYAVFHDTPPMLMGIAAPFLSFEFGIVLSFFTLVTNAGIVVCVVALNILNKSLIYNR
jgi:hypothetical protein